MNMPSDAPSNPYTRLKALEAGETATIAPIDPAGSLQARRGIKGVVFYWRFSLGAHSERMKIGPFDAAPASVNKLTPTPAGFSLKAAMKEAQRLAVEHVTSKASGDGGMPSIVAAKKKAKAEADAAAAALEAAKLAEAEAAKLAAQYTLEALMHDYCNQLQALGRKSHRDLRGMVALHIVGAWPKVAALPARDVTGEQVADMMRVLIEAGKARTANKLRTAMGAAFNMARLAKSSPSIPVRFKAYGVKVNPVMDTLPDPSGNLADKDPLPAAEMRRYWHAIKNLEGLKGAALRLHLLTGGQRIEQLCDLLPANLGKDSIVLMDGKGRPGRPARAHLVPLLPLAREALTQFQPKGSIVLSTDNGKTRLQATTLSRWAQDVAASIGIEEFQAKQLRSGVETLLASRGVSKETRAKLQSHGQSGVQATHYDAHTYESEKRMALEVLFAALEESEASNVVPLHAVG